MKKLEIDYVIVWELILSTGLQSDTFLYVVGTIIASEQFFTWKKSGNTVCLFFKL